MYIIIIIIVIIIIRGSLYRGSTVVNETQTGQTSCVLYYILNPGRGFFLFSPLPTTPPPTDLRREEDLCSFWEIAGKWPGELHTVDCCRTMIPRKIRAEVLICVHRFFVFYGVM